MNKPTKPSVLFVCVKNGGKSQMAAGLMRQIAGTTIDVYSAGTKPGTSVDNLSAQSLDEVGIDITAETPHAIADFAANEFALVEYRGACTRAELRSVRVVDEFAGPLRSTHRRHEGKERCAW